MAVNISLTVLSPAERLGHWARLTGFWPYGSAQHRQSTRMDEYSSGRSMAVLPVGDAAADLYGSRWSGIHGPSRVRRSMRSVPTTTTGAEDDSTAGLRAWPPMACSLLSDRGSRVFDHEYRDLCGSAQLVRALWLLARDSRGHRRTTSSVG
jgi:hypothetical protein